MDKTISWQAMTEHQRDTLIAEKIFAWQWIPAEMFSKAVKKDAGWLLPEHGLSAITYDFEAGWIDIGEKRFIPRNWILRYTTSLDAAWLLIEKLETSASLTYTRPFAPGYPEGRAAHYECKIIEWDPICGNDKVARAIANTPTEAICIAALRWVGIHVTHTIEAIPCWQVTFEDGEKLICRDRIQAERELASREQTLKDNLQWAKNVRKLKIEEIQVPEDYFNGPEIG